MEGCGRWWNGRVREIDVRREWESGWSGGDVDDGGGGVKEVNIRGEWESGRSGCGIVREADVERGVGEWRRCRWKRKSGGSSDTDDGGRHGRVEEIGMVVVKRNVDEVEREGGGGGGGSGRKEKFLRWAMLWFGGSGIRED